MKKYLIIVLAIVFGCQKEKKEIETTEPVVTDSIELPVDSVATDTEISDVRFRKVTAVKSGRNHYKVSGEAQVFEGAFSWSVEDGHNELASGSANVAKGAPSWSAFTFEFDMEKEDPESSVQLVLFEESAEDGSRTHQLPVPLY